MTGRGRGRPPRTTPPPVGQPGPMGPPPPVPAQQPPLGGAPSGMGGLPNFTTDILNQLQPQKQAEMMALVNRFRSKQMAIQDFLATSKILLGDRLYAILAQGMNSLARVPGAAPMGAAPFMMVRPQAGMPSAGLEDGGAASAMGDVTKMDSASLQDVIQYSGIDLRAEADLMEAELQQNTTGSGSAMHGQDLRMRPDHFFNLPRMKAIVYMAAKSKGITGVSEEVFELLALALQRRLGNLVTSLAETSKHRVDAGRVAFKIKVENDPKKQLWLLERVLEEQMDRTKEDYMAATGPQRPQTADEKGKAKKASGSDKKSTGEDIVVKTRLANTTAMAALGLTQKSWMTAGIVGLQQSSSSSAAASKQPGDPAESQASEETAEAVKIPLHFSQAPSATPVTDRDLLMQVNQRTVSLKDLVFVCERDAHLSRSPIMLTLYDLSNF